jgi:DNA (cytosine-5)-methyltransferase 1
MTDTGATSPAARPVSRRDIVDGSATPVARLTAAGASVSAGFPKLRVLDLFSGIGGFSLGLERTGGFETVAFCEIEPFPRRVLAKHWPGVPCYEDVRALTADTLARDGIGVDVICGGFPCQDISLAGKGAGIDGARSGLWSEYARLIGELQPRFVIVENVAALLGRGLDRVLGDLAALGYDAEWHCIPAAAVGAPHRRDRLWIVAHTNDERAELRKPERREANGASQRRGSLPRGCSADVAYPAGERRGEARGLRRNEPAQRTARSGEATSHTYGPRLSFPWPLATGEDGEHGGGVSAAGGWWAIEPDVGRVANGVPKRVDRLRALGNAVVPQIPELIGRAILAAEAALPIAAE